MLLYRRAESADYRRRRTRSLAALFHEAVNEGMAATALIVECKKKKKTRTEKAKFILLTYRSTRAFL